MNEEEFITKFYSCDDEEQFLKDVYHNLNCLQQENKQLKDKIPYIIQNNSCKYISIEKYKNKVCVNYKMQELQGSDSDE